MVPHLEWERRHFKCTMIWLFVAFWCTQHMRRLYFISSTHKSYQCSVIINSPMDHYPGVGVGFGGSLSKQDIFVEYNSWFYRLQGGCYLGLGTGDLISGHMPACRVKSTGKIVLWLGRTYGYLDIMFLVIHQHKVGPDVEQLMCNFNPKTEISCECMNFYSINK